MRTSVAASLIFLLIAIPCSTVPASAHELGGSAGRGDSGFAGVDAQAFDEMVFGSHGRSLRWARAPELVVLMSVMQYQPGESNTYAATSERLTDGEADQLIDDLTTALTLMTGGAFTTFASVRRELVETRATTRMLRQGQIVVGRFRGVRDAVQTIGLGGRAFQANGTITSGAVMLDSDYDRGSDRRRLLRTHELGHALGYNHVQARTSIMNARIGAELTEFDRQAASVTFRGISENAHDPLPMVSAK